jgi:malonyl-CoA O-methyltransferase
MSDAQPPSIDPVAARRWIRAAPTRSPWLHEEVGRRMESRLEWIRLQPQAWLDWEPVRGGLQAHELVAKRYARAQCWVAERDPKHAAAAKLLLRKPWWHLHAPAVRHEPVSDGAVQMVWANMALHMAPDPQTLLAQWHRALAVDGFLMFSCFGPDTLRELRTLYAQAGWPPPAHDFTDMHDWGDMLVHAGFAEPVMDMERVTLTWETPGRLLAELRELGVNLNRNRFSALRGRGFRRALEAGIMRSLQHEDGRVALTFEIVYGHAMRPTPRVKVAGESAVSMADMQTLLRAGRNKS